MRLPDSEHTSRPWRIHEIASDFELEDVWALPTPGGPDEFGRLVEGMAAGDPAQSPSRVARTLFSLRWKLGDLLGWDDDADAPTIRDRLPADLHASPGPQFEALPFASLYLTGEEFAAEIANRTVHGVMHLSWVPVPDRAESYRGQMAVLVKPNGALGTAYMTAIKPFRYTTVYPAMLKQIEREWNARDQSP